MADRQKKMRILLADDHLVVRMGIATIISFEPDMEVVAEADTGDEAIQFARDTGPDVVVMDLMMPGTDGADATAAIVRENPSAKILILTTFGTSDEMRRASPSTPARPARSSSRRRRTTSSPPYAP